jgi:hypothetical protein
MTLLQPASKCLFKWFNVFELSNVHGLAFYPDTLDEELEWRKHIETVCRKLIDFVGMFFFIYYEIHCLLLDYKLLITRFFILIFYTVLNKLLVSS